jgi:hypothetical protein
VKETEALIRAEQALLDDPEFEYLDKKIKDVVWEFVCRVAVEPTTDHVADFISNHARPAKEDVCFFTMLHLDVPAEFSWVGARFLPAGHADVPSVLEVPQGGSVVAVPVSGTDQKRMMARARAVAEHAVKVLRVALRERHRSSEWQLQFSLGSTYAFVHSRIQGWRRTAPVSFTVPAETVQQVQGDPVASIPSAGGTDVQQRGRVAVRWIDRAMRLTDEAEAVSWLMAGLEALLSEKDKGLKGHAVVFRRTMLGHLVEGNAPWPALLYWAYNEARSSTVHGSEPPLITPYAVTQVLYSVRRALNEFLEFADAEGLRRRHDVIQRLDGHDDAPMVLAGPREGDPDTWAKWKAPWETGD